MKTVKEVADSLNVSKQTVHYHLKSLPPNLSIKKKGNKSLIDNDTFCFLRQTVNNKSTNKSPNFDDLLSNEKSENENYPNSYIDKYLKHLESEIQQKNHQIDDLTIALKQAQSLNLNSQNILSDNNKNEIDVITEENNTLNSKETVYKSSEGNKKSLLSKLFKKSKR